MRAPVPTSPPSRFALTRTALRADRFRAGGVALTCAALALALWAIWAAGARLPLRASTTAGPNPKAAAAAPAGATLSPAQLTLSAAGLARRGR